VTSIPIETLTPEAFEPFGRVIRLPDRSADAEGPGWTRWAETALLPSDGRSFGVGYLDLRLDRPRFDWAERHLRTVEVILPLSGDCLAYVGPPEYLDEPERIPAQERFRVFRIAAGQGIAMDPGVWHGAPLATDEPLTAAVLILEGTGSQDTTIVRFPDEPIDIGV